MKQATAGILILLLCFSAPIANATDNLNLLWDIPFTTRIEDFPRLAYEKSGLVINKPLMNDTICLDYSQNASLLGYPLDSIIVASENPITKENCGTIQSISITIDKGAELLAAFIDIFNALCLQYGINSDAFCFVEGTYYDFPFTEDGEINEHILRMIWYGQKNSDDTATLQCTWNNVDLRANIGRNGQWLGLLFRSYPLPDNYDVILAGPYPTKPQDTPIPVRDVDVGF